MAHVSVHVCFLLQQGVLQHVLSTGDILDHNIYAHGGVPFWFGSSLLFLIVRYPLVLLVLLLLCVCVSEYLWEKKE